MSRLVSWFTELSYRRAGFVVAAIVLVLVGGSWSATRINQELLPDVQFPIVVVVAQVPDGQPDEVVRNTVAPIEAATSSLPDLQSTQSVVVQGLGVVLLEFDFGVPLDETEDLVNEQLNALQFPEGVETSLLMFDPSTFPVVIATLEGNLSDRELLDLANGTVVPRLNEIDGVGSVDIVGGTIREVAVELDRESLVDAGFSYPQLRDVLAGSNVILPAGAAVGEGGAVPLEAVAVLTSIDDLQEVRIPTPDGESVRLGDIATVSERDSAPTGVNRANGNPSVGIQVTKTQDANTVSVAHEVIAVYDDLAPELPAGVQIDVIEDQAEFIEESVFDMVVKGVIGGVLAIIIVFAFLGSFRSTLVTAVSIPLSILAAIVALEYTGNTLNLMTLGGLTIAIGRVIDDSIVVLESIYRHMAAGENTFTAVTRGAREVTLAIVGATATTAAVFLPLGLVGGIIGELFLPFALAVVLALIASLLVAVTVVPALVRILMSRGVKIESEDRPRERWISHGYRPVLLWSLRHRWATLGVAGVAFIGSLALIPTLPVVFLPDSGENTMTITVPAAAGETRDDVLDRAILVEGLLGAYDVENFQTVITGTSGGFGAVGAVISGDNPNSATISVTLAGSESKEDVAEELRGRFPDEIPGGEDVTVSTADEFAGGNAVDITVSASTAAGVANLEAAATMVEGAITGMDGLTNLRSDVSETVSAIELRIDQPAVVAAGLTVPEVAGSIEQLTASDQVTAIQGEAGQLPVRLEVAAEEPLTVDALESFVIAPGVKLGEVATPVEVQRQASITRIDGRQAASVNAEIVGDNVSAVSADVVSTVDGLDLPAGVEVSHGGIGSDIDEGFANMLFAIVASIVLVYVVMALLFRSWLDPFVILFTLPLAVVGAIVALVVTGSALSINVMLGLLMLVGIVVTNAIVMLEFINMLRHERGFSTYDAIVEGAQVRIRPVLMTALATILALVPLASGFFGAGLISAELGRVVIGGLFSATLLTLIIVPVVYSLVDDARRKFGRASGDSHQPVDA